MATVQLQMFKRRVVDDLGLVGSGATAPRLVRADDGLTYIAKDEAAGVASVRASEYLWLSLARAIGLPAATPEILELASGRLVIGTRREEAAIGKDHHTCLHALLSGAVIQGGAQLSRIFAFDLFSANWDRHPGNYLVLKDGAEIAVFAIDFSHVPVHPGLPAAYDPISTSACATRGWFPTVIAPYAADATAAAEVADRLAALPVGEVEAILTTLPDDWLSPGDKDGVRTWWQGGLRVARTTTLKQGLANGTYL